MGTVFRFGRYRVMIFTNDHVFGADGNAKIALGGPCESPVVIKNEGLSTREVTTILVEIEARQDLLLLRWRQIHGDA